MVLVVEGLTTVVVAMLVVELSRSASSEQESNHSTVPQPNTWSLELDVWEAENKIRMTAASTLLVRLLQLCSSRL